MNKPILFIDEKPFWGGDNTAKKQYQEMKENLISDKNLDKIEFFFEKNDVFPFYFGSDSFKKVVENRVLIIVHNSYPQSQDKSKTLFPDNVIEEMRVILKGKMDLVRFSGNMYRRGLTDEEAKKRNTEGVLKIGQPLIKEDLKVERDDIYEYLPTFIKHCLKLEYTPNYFILKYGLDAQKGEASEIKHSMQGKCWEWREISNVSKSLISTLNYSQKRERKKVLKNDWKQIVEEDMLKILEIAGTNEQRKFDALKYFYSTSTNFTEYFTTLEKVIQKEIKSIES